MLCENTDHERWRGIMFATNGCLACHCEEQAVLITELEAEVDQLREALRPFADVAKGIPDNWPGECRVRVDIGLVQEWLSYYEAGTPNATFPTIAEWRAVLATQQPEGEGGK